MQKFTYKKHKKKPETKLFAKNQQNCNDQIKNQHTH